MQNENLNEQQTGVIRVVFSDLLAVSYGGGTNSTAMLCGFRTRGIKPSLIIFADTGAEMPHTYQHVEIMRAKIREWWNLELVTVMATRHKQPWTIVQDCEKKSCCPRWRMARGHARNASSTNRWSDTSKSGCGKTASRKS